MNGIAGCFSEILIDFLNQLFKGHKVIRDLTYNSTEKYGDDEQSKKVVFDLFCTCDNDEQIIVEMQRRESPSSLYQSFGKLGLKREALAWEMGEEWTSPHEHAMRSSLHSINFAA